jgi:hypothetical protein
LLTLTQLSIAISGIIFLGCVADLLVVNDEWAKLKRRLFLASQRVKNSSLNDLMYLIANKVYKLLSGTATFFKYQKKFTSSQNDHQLKRITFLTIAGFGLAFLYILIFRPKTLLSLILFFPIFAIVLLSFFVLIFFEAKRGKHSDKFDNYWRVFFKTSFISGVVTYIAIALGNEIFSYYRISEFWFDNTENLGVMRFSAYMGLINYPFDFLSLTVTYWCAKQISQKNGIYYLYPILDVLSSTLLSSCLYIILYSISKSEFSIVYLPATVLDLAFNGPAKAGYDFLYLLPIILTSLVPIFSLSSIFFILIFYKIFSRFLSRFLRVLSEKEGSIFKDIAAALAALVALLNCILGK